MGTGKAIIATPYLHAQEVLAENRGLLCKFRDHKSITHAIIQLLEDYELRKNMERKVYRYSRDFTWARVAKRYAELFRRMINS
jgi:glycosyltransferase involved in cell wall biosynthesis